ncbi:MAG: ABC transporter substrate-binding protein [Flavobacteriaceae bacterium]
MKHLEKNIFSVKYTPKRIISLVPSQTELLFDLGLEKEVIGITKFCIHPVEARKEKKIVGGTKMIKIDKIKALQPDIILCNKEENTKEIVELCQEIAPTHVSDLYTLDDARNLIEEYGALFSKEESANNILQKLDSEYNSFQSYIADKPILTAAYFIWKDPWMVAANNTFINHMLALNKYENTYQHLTRYPEVTLNKIHESGNPDLIFLSSEPYPFKEKHIDEIKEYAPNAKILLVDGELFSWYGSRLLHSFEYFKSLRELIE